MFSLNKIVERKSAKPLFQFKNGDYGVSCSRIYNLLRECQADNYISIISAKEYDQKHDQYKIEEKGRKIGKDCFNKLPPMSQIIWKRLVNGHIGAVSMTLLEHFMRCIPLQ